VRVKVVGRRNNSENALRNVDTLGRRQRNVHLAPKSPRNVSQGAQSEVASASESLRDMRLRSAEALGKFGLAYAGSLHLLSNSLRNEEEKSLLLQQALVRDLFLTL